MIEKVETSTLTEGDRQDTLTDNDNAGQEGRYQTTQAKYHVYWQDIF